MEWVHCHIARQPVSARERVEGLPEPICAIIMKLLAKDPEERYQTAAGLESDLRRCLSAVESEGRIEPFPLGAHDATDRLLIPEKLYGREKEIGLLLTAFDRIVREGTSELVLISGYSGVGKSSLVNELHQALVSSRGLFAAGKFDQYKRDIPYATLAQAFDKLVRQILTQSDTEVHLWREALVESLGPNGQLIVNLIPEIELIIGKQPPVSELPSQDAKNRIQLALRRLIGIFARPEHPLAIFLDDLQWLDAATLELIEHLLTEPGTRHVLIVGAYRDNEVGLMHPLRRTVEVVEKSGARVEQIVLKPLDLGDVERMIAAALHTVPADVNSLAALVFEKTAGNPFFVIQFVMALAEEGLLSFDAETRKWTSDIERIRAKAFTENVADLMGAKLGRLPPATKVALGQLACLGSVAGIQKVTLAHGGTEEEVRAHLQDAVLAGFLFEGEGEYAFLHDRVQEAAYSLIPPDERAVVHLRIGRALASGSEMSQFDENIFEIVNQFDRGRDLIDSEIERERVAEFNLAAAKRANSSAAFVEALKYLAAGCELLRENRWRTAYRLAFDLELHRAECEFLTGDTTAAEARLLALSSRAGNLVDQASVTCMQMALYTTLGRGDQAIDASVKFLRREGIDWRKDPDESDIEREYVRLAQLLGDRPIEDLIDLPLMVDAERRATIDVLVELVPTAMIVSNNELLDFALLQMANLSMQHGLCDGSAYAFASLNIVLGFRFNDYHAGLRFGKLGCDLVTKRELERFKTRALANFGIFTVPWTQNMRVGREMILRGFDVAELTGDLSYAIYCSNVLIGHSLISGESLEKVHQEALRCLALVEKAGFGLFVKMTLGELRFIQDLRGHAEDKVFLDDARQDGGSFEQDLEEAGPLMGFGAAICWTRKLQRSFFAGEIAAGVHAAILAAPHFQRSRHILHVGDYHFYGALIRAAAMGSASDDELAHHFEALCSHFRQIEVWAKSCPENFENRAALVSAEIARVEGRELEAQRLYEEAIRSARKHGFVQNEGVAHEVAARFYLARGFETIALAYLRNARSCYRRWGAHGKVRQLDQDWPELRDEAVVVRQDATIGTPVEQIDLTTIVRVSQAVSSEILLERLIDKLMVIAVEHAGAVRGLLLLSRGDEFRVAAEAVTARNSIDVSLRDGPVTAADLPVSILRYVVRTQESLLLDDGSVKNPFPDDPYIQANRSRSILCLPLVKQGKLIGALYLENWRASHVFTQGRIDILNLLASQAAISLENALLYADLLEVKAELRTNERELRQAQDSIPSFVWSALPDGSGEAFNKAWHDYTGISVEDAVNGGWVASYHPHDVGKVLEKWSEMTVSGADGEVEARMRRFDGEYRSFLVRGKALRDEGGEITRWYGSSTDIEDRKQAEQALERSKLYLEHAQRLSHTGSVGLRVSDGQIFWSDETARIYGYDPALPATMEMVLKRVHPEDVELLTDVFARAMQGGGSFQFEHRLLMPDGTIKYISNFAHSVQDEAGHEEVLGAVMDITDRRRVEDELKRSEVLLAQAQRLTQTSSLRWKVATGEVFWTEESYRLMEYDRSVTPTVQMIMDRCHPDDLPFVQEMVGRSAQFGTTMDFQHRLLMPNGAVKHVHILAQNIGLKPQDFEFVGAVTDITENVEAKSALEDALAEVKESEDRFRTIIDTIPSLAWRTRADGYAEFYSQRWFDYTGLTFEQAKGHGWTTAIHPDDRQMIFERWTEIMASEASGEVEARFQRYDGEYRWHLFRTTPRFDEQGRILNWYGTNTDIDDLKRAEALLAGEKRLFEMIATGHGLAETLEALCLIVEELAEGALVSIMLLDEDTRRLHHGAAPSVPSGWLQATDGGLIGPSVGSCGTAAYLGEQVFVTDIATDPLWTDYAELALSYGLRACFSTPILSSERKVLGTFAIYSKQARAVTSREASLSEQFTHLAGIVIERKRAEDALRKSEALLAEGQRISQTGTWVWNLSTGMIVWSEEHCRIFGFGIDQTNVAWETFLGTIHASDLARVQAVLDDARRRGCEFSIEYRIRLSDGSAKYIYSRGRPVVGQLGQVQEFIGTAMDISYRYEAKVALENALAKVTASEDQLRTLIDTMPGLAWTAGPNGEGEFLSKSWLDYTGMTEEEAAGPGWANAIHPDDVGLHVERWQKIIATKKQGELEARLRRFDGEYRWFSFRGAPLLDKWGHVVKWYGVNIDIEEQKHSEQEMRKLVAIIENSSDCVGYAKSPQEVVYVNSAWRRFAGLDADEDIAKYQMTDFLPKEEHRRFLEDILPTLARDGQWEGERYLHNIKTKVAAPFHQTIFFITEASTDRRIGIATVSRNITESKLAEQELRKSEVALRKAESDLAHVARVTTMGELTASIAHEVNQPIAGVVINGNACLRWLAREAVQSENIVEASEAVQRIIRDGTRAGEVIARIRALFKKAESPKALLEINEVIHEVLVLARSEMDKRRVVVRLELAPDLPPVFGDRVQLQQVMLNLILNGIEAMIMVQEQARVLIIGTHVHGETEVLVTVCDSGIGIDPLRKDEIFTAFHTTKPGGLGMGLSISRTIVESHNGRLWATANDGQGATFQFTLPLHLEG
jgi:PAS domain S-box-containing protein